jgi:hypothetical protein
MNSEGIGFPASRPLGRSTRFSQAVVDALAPQRQLAQGGLLGQGSPLTSRPAARAWSRLMEEVSWLTCTHPSRPSRRTKACRLSALQPAASRDRGRKRRQVGEMGEGDPWGQVVTSSTLMRALLVVMDRKAEGSGSHRFQRAGSMHLQTFGPKRSSDRARQRDCCLVDGVDR